LIDCARRAEEVRFDFAMISDHYHPWIDRQGQSSFVWSVLGGLSQATERITIGAAGPCPTMRIHPAIIAQAAVTVAAMLPGRFILGVGSGENLNEHILGAHWPEIDVRREMLEEAVEVIRLLWPTAALTGELSQVIPVPAHFEQATKLVKEEDVAKEIVCGPDRERCLAKINEYVEAGYDHVWVHQVGPDQEGFFRFFEKAVLPKPDRD